MASLLTDPLFEISGTGPAPTKTFYHLSVRKSLITWRWWKISLRTVDRYIKPGELKESHQDFLDESELQSEIGMVFGHHILQYTKALCQGHFDYLERLPNSLLLYVMNYLELEDVVQLGRTSHRFRQLCWSEGFWEQTVHRHCRTVSAEVASLALEVGWRSVFFTSKLQLQKLVSRRRLKSEEEQKEQIIGPDSTVEKSPDASSEKDHISSPDLDSLPDIIPDPTSGTETGTGFDTNSCCEADSRPKPDTSPLSGQLLQDIKKGLDDVQEPED